MREKKLQGIIAPLITPFTSDGQIDEARLRGEIQVLLDAKVDGISPGGSTGEGAALADDELARMVRIVREMDENVLIVAGVIRNCTRAAVKGCLAAQAAGADALMVTPVSYNVLVPDDEGNYSFYKDISDNVRLPIVIYNVVPQNTIRAELFQRLLEIEHVAGIKQSCGGIGAFYEMKMVNGAAGKIFSATDEMIFSTFTLGADGAISAILTVFPELCAQMWQAARQGDFARGLAIQNRIYPVWRAIAGSQFPIRVKHALKLLGREPGYPRAPIVHISEQDQAAIERALRASGFLA